ncbi:hypothetical protein ACRAKI_35845 [Saccharothrix isguenensis]
MVIRPLAADDIPTVVEFPVRAWAPVFDSFRAVLGVPIYEALFPDWEPTQAKAVEDVCRDDATAVWVDVRENRAVGFVAVRMGNGEIPMPAVDPDRQRSPSSARAAIPATPRPAAPANAPASPRSPRSSTTSASTGDRPQGTATRRRRLAARPGESLVAHVERALNELTGPPDRRS